MALKYLSLKEIEDAVTDPNFGEKIEFETGSSSHPYPYPSSYSGSYPSSYSGSSSHLHLHSYSYSYSGSSSHSHSYSYPYSYPGPGQGPGPSSHPYPHPYLCDSQDLNYNLKPPVYTISKLPIRAISIPPLETLADSSNVYTFDVAHFNNVNTKILAAIAISERLKVKSDAFLNV